MAYKYIDVAKSVVQTSPSTQYRDAFQALLNDQFQNSPTVREIYEEEDFGSGILIPITVRINRAINSATGQKLGDDFKLLLFPDLDHSAGLGKKFYFSNNYWIVVFSENIMNLGASCMVRRCNEYLRFVLPDGTYYEEPCAVEYEIQRSRDTSGAENPVVPSGYIDAYAQLNSKTELIKGNQRFLFGKPNNRLAFRIFGNGVQSMLRQETDDESSARLLRISMGGNYVNLDTDDLVNGIADRYLNYKKFDIDTSSPSIVVTPDDNYLLEGETQTYTVEYQINSVPQSGSFIFSVSGSAVPSSYYTLTAIDGNSFSIKNNAPWLADSLEILCSGSSGSRILSVDLKGAW